MRLGFRATTLQKISENAGVNRTVIHYYFRSKENLYGEIIKEIIPMLKGLRFPPNERFSYLWFIIIELRTNRSYFVNSLVKNGYHEWNRTIEKSVFQEFIKIGAVQF